ncbi:hypothetical protein SESBI_44102 [Sesbania bispinosa]|nr:hypothetical protein SESBI_44102 [Sesbania bispinosa]
MNSKIVRSPDSAYANEEVGAIFRFGLSFLARVEGEVLLRLSKQKGVAALARTSNPKPHIP